MHTLKNHASVGMPMPSESMTNRSSQRSGDSLTPSIPAMSPKISRLVDPDLRRSDTDPSPADFDSFRPEASDTRG